MIVDLRPLKQASGIDESDVAKRLMDYGFHAPTISFPVPGTLMIEPTESEAQDELDRFCDALIAIRAEIQAVIDGKADKQDNVLKNAPHTAAVALADEWTHPYTRQQAVFPLPFVKANKVWPTVGRIDNAYGDRHLVCACMPIEAYAQRSRAGRLRLARIPSASPGARGRQRCSPPAEKLSPSPWERGLGSGALGSRRVRR